jgi:hypothetical protein
MYNIINNEPKRDINTHSELGFEKLLNTRVQILLEQKERK